MASLATATAFCILMLSTDAAQADWVSRRAALVQHLLGTDGTLPNRSQPDFAWSVPGPQMKGCFCSQQGNCNASQCQWSNNMTRLVWTIELPVNDSYTIKLNSTVFHTLNTSGVAPVTATAVNAEMPEPPLPVQRLSDTLVLHHHGHDTPHDYCTADWDGTTDWYNQLGYDVMTLQMPLLGCNWQPGYPGPEDHAWFKQWDDQGLPAMRFFIEPIVLTINYALTLGYKRVIMTGLSGGGWSTTVAAAIDPRITLSMPVAGSIPCEFEHTSWDFEQWGPCGANGARSWPVNYTEMYVLAGLEQSRYSLQLIHEHDPCCFHGYGRHPRIIGYNKWVQTQISGHFETTPTVGNVHEVNFRDKTIIAMMLDKLRMKGRLDPTDFETIPFNTLYEYA